MRSSELRRGIAKLLNHYDGVNPVVNFAIINPAGGQNSTTGVDKNERIWYKGPYL